MDRNQATGLLLISILLIGYLYFFSDPVEPPDTEPAITEQAEKEGAIPEKESQPKQDSIESPKIPEAIDLVDSAYPYISLLQGEQKTFVLENRELKVEISSRGGYPKKVELKNFKTWKKEPLILLDEKSSAMAFTGFDRANKAYNLYDFYYSGEVEREIIENDTNSILTLRAPFSDGFITQRYVLKNGSFEMDYSLDLGPLENRTPGGLTFQWINNLKRFENTMDQSRNESSVNYLDKEGDVNKVSNGNDAEIESEEATGRVKWISMKQRFFNAGFIAPGYLPRGSFSSQFDPADSSIIKSQRAEVLVPLALLGKNKEPFRFYLGPNNYQILKKVDVGYGENIYLGWTVFATVNKYTVVPFFNFLERYISNYGLIIFILVLAVKILLFPLSYKSYTGMARMKVLKPEIEEIKERIGDDSQKVQMETMKLYQKFGVNPLAGCVPVALQIPVLFALFNFFPNSVELRQQGFLWADDLSTYDSIWDLPFTIPFYGDHVSLFTLLMTVSTVAYTYVQNQGNPMQQQGPMKTMQYFFPIMIMFFLNNFSAGLTYYYFLSNIVTIAQQFIIRKFTDDSEIRAQLEAKHHKKKHKKKSKFQQKLDDAMGGSANKSDKVDKSEKGEKPTPTDGQNRAMRRQMGKK
jgi:YidC/Oxa1 family membrane protein insertase